MSINTSRHTLIRLNVSRAVSSNRITAANLMRIEEVHLPGKQKSKDWFNEEKRSPKAILVQISMPPDSISIVKLLDLKRKKKQ